MPNVPDHIPPSPKYGRGAGGEATRDLAHYGVSIVRASVPPDARYWKIIAAYHLSGAENKGGHSVYIDMLNADGSRRYGARCNIWAGGKLFIATISQPPHEPGTSFPMASGATYDVEGAEMPSDKAVGFSADGPEEEAGNAPSRHSFMVVFGEAVAGEDTTTGTVRGTVAGGAGMSINLQGGHLDLTSKIAGDGRFGFDNVPTGTYTLNVVGTNASGVLTVTAGQQAFITLSAASSPAPLQRVG
ncbi:MAG: hypothetical protein HYR71_05460, partial [Chloroflexi bacterium]|nr:hypothetical protein [Chloroflexota bacterium]